MLCLAAAEDSSTIGCALSNGEVKVYDTERLHSVATFPVKPNSSITDLFYGPSSHTLLATAVDGSLTVLDVRCSSPSMEASVPTGQPALCADLGYDGYLAAVGSKARVHFLDWRANGRLLGTYVDAHTDAVVDLCFTDATLLTGAEDGLACVFDTRQATEELALQSVINVGAPLRRVGWTTGATMWCLTGNETASLWDAETACCRHDFGNLREDLSLRLGSSIDYLIDAYWDGQQLSLSTGNAQGDVALVRFEPEGWQLGQVLSGGHRGVVRGAVMLSPSTLMTAGEDARLCEWNLLGRQAYASPRSSPTNARRTVAGTRGGGGPLRRQRIRPAAGPY